MNTLAFLKAGRLDHELALTAVVLVVVIMGYLVYRGMKNSGENE